MILLRSLKTKLLQLFLFCLASVAMYWRARDGMFSYAWVDWVIKYKEIGAKGLLNGFGDVSLHHVYHLAFFLTYKLFGLNSGGWQVEFGLLHGLVAFTAFVFFGKLLRKMNHPSADWIATAAAVLFLISPYNTEVVVWGATIHYLIASFLILSCCILLLDFMQTGDLRLMLLIHVLFIVAVLSLEIALTFPIMILAFVFFLPEPLFRGASRSDVLKKFFLPQIFLLGIYVAVNKLTFGSSVGHYGAATHLNFSPQLIVSNFDKYLLKYGLLFQFFKYSWKEHVYGILEKPFSVWLSLAGFSMAAIYGILNLRKLSGATRMIFFAFVLFCLAIGPVINLYFNYLTHISGDRFAYYAGIFFYLFFVLLIEKILGRLNYLVLGITLLFSFAFLQQNISRWQGAGAVEVGLENGYRWSDAKKVFVLNIPDSFDGACMYPAFQPYSMFADALYLKRGIDIRDKIFEVVKYNMNSVSDSVVVAKSSSDELQVTLGQWGNWWWQDGKGAGSYENEMLTFTPDEWRHSYRVKFKTKISGAVYIYQCGSQWREVEGF